MYQKPDLDSLLVKHKGISQSDFILAKVAAKLDALEIILIERLYQNVSERQQAFHQLDSDVFSLMDSYLEMLAKKSSGGLGSNGSANSAQN